MVKAATVVLGAVKDSGSEDTQITEELREVGKRGKKGIQTTRVEISMVTK